MKQSKILQSGATVEWYAKCYQEYLQDCAQNYQDLLSCLQSLMFAEDPDGYPDGVPADEIDQVIGDHAGSYIGRACAQFNISPDAYVPFQQGYVSVRDLGCAVLRNAWSQTDSTYDAQANPIHVERTLGQVNYSYSVAEAVSEMKESLVSTVTTAAGFAAMAKDAMSDRLAIFENQIAQVYSEIPDASSQIVSSIRASIQTATSVLDYASTFVEQSVPSAVQEGGDGIYADTDMSVITGANPAIAADFSSIKNIGGAAIRAGATLVAGVFGGLLAIGKQLFSKAKQYVTDVLLDPEVLVKLEEGDGFGLVDGFQWQTRQSQVMFDISASLYDSLLAHRPLDSYLNRWYKYSTLGGEQLIRLKSWECWLEGGRFETLRVSFEGVFRPYMLSMESQSLVRSYMTSHATELAARTPTSTTYDADSQFVTDTVDFLSDFQSIASKYGSLELTNAESYAGLLYAIWLHKIILTAGTNELITLVDPESIQLSMIITNSSNVINSALDNGIYSKSVNNANILKICTNDFKYGALDRNDDIFYPLFKTEDMFLNLVKLMVLQSADRREHPLDYVFIPYSNNAQNFSKPDFRIKTDSEIQQSVTNFITTAIVVVIVAVAAVSAFAIVKKIAKANFFKNQQTVGRLDSKMWNGETLTKKEQRQYLRAQKRLAKSKVLDFSKPNLSTESSPNDSSVVISLITG